MEQDVWIFCFSFLVTGVCAFQTKCSVRGLIYCDDLNKANIQDIGLMAKEWGKKNLICDWGIWFGFWEWRFDLGSCEWGAEVLIWFFVNEELKMRIMMVADPLLLVLPGLKRPILFSCLLSCAHSIVLLDDLSVFN